MAFLNEFPSFNFKRLSSHYAYITFLWVAVGPQLQVYHPTLNCKSVAFINIYNTTILTSGLDISLTHITPNTICIYNSFPQYIHIHHLFLH